MTIIYFHRLHFPSSSGQTIQVIRDYYGMSESHRVRLFYRAPQELSNSRVKSCLQEHGADITPSFSLDWVAEGVAAGYYFRKCIGRLVKESDTPLLLVTRTLDHAKQALGLVDLANSGTIKVVLELHETAIPHLIYQQQKRSLRSLMSKHLERKVFSSINGIIATVAPQQELLDRLFPGHAPTVLLPNSYQPCARPESGVSTSRGTFHIRYAGQFNDWKNTDILFRAIKQLPVNFFLEIAGGKMGEEVHTRQKLETICTRYGVGGRVGYLGVLPPADVPNFLRNADCLVLPLGDNIQSRLFTSPMKLFEYAASGTPMVVTAHPTTCSLVRDGQEALMVRPNDENELASAIRRIVTDTELATRLSGNARQWVEQFSVRNRVSRYNEFINFLCAAQ